MARKCKKMSRNWEPGKFLLLPPPPTESGRLPEMTEKVAGGIGRVPPPQTRILATPLPPHCQADASSLGFLQHRRHTSAYVYQTLARMHSPPLVLGPRHRRMQPSKGKGHLQLFLFRHRREFWITRYAQVYALTTN